MGVAAVLHQIYIFHSSLFYYILLDNIQMEIKEDVMLQTAMSWLSVGSNGGIL
jgi:hypothetical protein